MSTPAPANEPRRHHFVPQAFLRSWCANGTELCRMFVRHGKVHCYPKSSTSRVAYRNDLYNLRSAGESLGVRLALVTLGMKHGRDVSELNFEKTLMGEIDQRGADALQKFLTDPRAPGDTAALYDLLRFLYLLENRNPRVLERMQATSVADLERLVGGAGLGGSPLLSVDDFRQDLTAAKITVVEAVLNEREFRRRYDGMACALAHVDPSANRFVTADAPYVRLPGKTFYLHLAPLSPTICLVMSDRREMVEGIKRCANERFVDYVNFALMCVAEEVYAWDDRVRPVVADHLGLMWRDQKRACDILLDKFRLAVQGPA